MPNYVQVIVAIIIAILSYFYGYSSRTDTPPPRDKLGDELRRIATEKEADTALVFGKRDGVNAVHIPSGNPIPLCDKRTRNQEQCKYDVKKDSNGKYLLLNKETHQEEPIISEGHVFIHPHNSYCTTSSSGGHTTTNCCHSPPCW